jgi:hypothetical protein
VKALPVLGSALEEKSGKQNPDSSQLMQARKRFIIDGEETNLATDKAKR